MQYNRRSNLAMFAVADRQTNPKSYHSSNSQANRSGPVPSQLP